MNYKGMKEKQVNHIVNNIINNPEQKWQHSKDSNVYFYMNSNEVDGVIYVHVLSLMNNKLVYVINIDAYNSSIQGLEKLKIKYNGVKYITLSEYHLILNKDQIKLIQQHVVTYN